MSIERDWKLLGTAVRHARIRAGFRTQEQWSQHLGISVVTVGALERGNSVSDPTLVAVEDALGWPAGQAQKVLAGTGGSERDGVTPQQHAEDLISQIPTLTRKGRQQMLDYYEYLRSREDKN